MRIPLSAYGWALSVTLAVSCRSSREAQSPDTNVSGWQKTPLTIDGSDKDWDRPLPYFVNSDKLSYAVTNDGQNLYILMTTKSPQEQQKIIQGGMTVWINTKAEKTQGGAIGIGYPLDTRNDRDRQIMESAQPQRYNHTVPKLEDRKDYSIYGFGNDSIPTYTYGDDNPQGIVMRMDYNNSGELIYEAAIPLKTLYPEHNTSSSYAAKSVAVGFLIEALPPDANVPREGGGGGPAIGVGGGLGFGSFGSGGGIGLSIGTGTGIGGGRGGTKGLFKPTEIWQVVQLSGR